MEAESFSLGAFSLYNVDEVRESFTISSDTEAYEYCNQDLRSYIGLSFPALPQWQAEGEEWMTPEQEEIVAVHGWSSLVVLVVIVSQLVFEVTVSIRRFFIGHYRPRGDDQGVGFSDVPTIASYIPQVPSELFAYPLLLVDTKGVDSHLFDWQDPDKPHSHYDVTQDLETIMGRTGFADAFAKVAHWDKTQSKTPEEQAISSKSTSETAEVIPPGDVTADIVLDHVLAENLCLKADGRSPN